MKVQPSLDRRRNPVAAEGIRVGPEGPKDAELAIVGEAPGADEIRFGRPFVGSSGKLLERCLRRANLLRSYIYITNTFKNKPRFNQIDAFFVNKSRNAVKPEYADQPEEMVKELQELPNLKVVVALGSTALWALTGEKQLTKWRGSPLTSDKLPGVTIIPAYHPAACLRQWIWTHILTADLNKAHDIKDSRLTVGKERFPLLPTDENFRTSCFEYLAGIGPGDTISVDIEVMNQTVSCLGIGKSATSAVVVPFHTSPKISGRHDESSAIKHSYWTDTEEVKVWQEIVRILEDHRIGKIFQNAMFDMSFMHRAHGVVTRGPIHDTMIMHHDIYPELPKGLDFLTSFYTTERYYKDELKEWAQNKTDFVKLWEYNAKDAMYTYEIWERLQNEIEHFDVRSIVDFDHSLLEPLLFVTVNGFRVDVPCMQKHKEALELRADKLQQQLGKLLGRTVNVNSPKQMRELMYEPAPLGFGLKEAKNRKTGKTTANEEAIKAATAKLKPDSPARIALEAVLEIRKCHKLVGTYLDIKYTNKSRVHASYNIGGTVTGRISSSKDLFGGGVQMQNIPKSVRDFFVPDRGTVLVQCDASQAEARVVAEIARDVRLKAAFDGGGDVHRNNAANIFGCSLEDVTKDQRAIGKRVQHAADYDMSWRTFSITAGIPAARAKQLLSAFHNTYPGIKQWHLRVRQQLERDRTLTNPFGRRFTFLGRWGDDLFRMAYAFVPQSTVADQLNRALRWLYYNTHNYDCLASVTILTQVHDSIVFCVEESDMVEACCLVKQAMEAPIKITHDSGQVSSLSIPSDFEYGHNWGNQKIGPGGEVLSNPNGLRDMPAEWLEGLGSPQISIDDLPQPLFNN